MVPWAPLFVFQVLWIGGTLAAAMRSRIESEGDSQAEIEEYLRALTQAQRYRPASPIVGDPSYSNSRVSEMGSDEYSQKHLQNIDAGRSQPWQKGVANAFASSVSHKPMGNDGIQFDAKAIAFSSIKDVESEELLDRSNENILPPSNEAEKKAESVQHAYTVSEAMARKSGGLTTGPQNTDTIKAESFSDVYFVAIVAGCSAAGIFGVISAGFCFYKLQKTNKASAEVEYPAYGVTGPSKDTTSPNGDRKLAQSAQMYHYQHQKQQMIAVEKAGSTKNTSASDADSEEENEEGDYTVYECPGLATTGEMEVKNPLFNDDSTPMSPPVLPAKSESIPSK